MSHQAPPPPRPIKPSTVRTAADPRALHAQEIVTRRRFDPFFYNTLITLYSKQNLSLYSLRVFSQILKPTVASWTALINAHSDSFLALRQFVSMLRHPTLPNQRTIACLFKTCVSLSCVAFGLGLHALSLKLSIASEPYSGSALVNFYSKFRLPCDARKVFDEITDRDEVCCSALVVGLAQNSRPVDALVAFWEMVCGGFRSTMFSVSGAVSATSELAALELCRMVHCHAVVTGLDRNVVVASSLVDSYGRAGVVSDARRLFDDNSATMNDVGWNAMMSAYAQHGDKDSTIELFNSMEERGLVPDRYSFLAILSSFCNSRTAIEAEEWFLRMRSDYNLNPGIEHYTCLVGALGRAGKLLEAEKLITIMPYKPDAPVWRALLSACAAHGDADKAWKMAKRILELDPRDESALVIVANVLAGVGRWDEVAGVRKMMKDRKVSKEIGRSWIEVRGKVHAFSAGDKRHDMNNAIHAKLAELMEVIEKLGYKPVLDEVLYDVGVEEKKKSLWGHSEKLALAFGVLSGIPAGKAIRIVKNLRICGDCHKAFGFMSTILNREIIVRDVNRYHRFSNGDCTCGGSW